MYKILIKNNVQKGDISIPFNNNNSDYQEYLQWLEEGNIPEVDPKSLLKLNETQAEPEKWTKEGEEDRSEQPMIAERWSDGVTTVWSEAEVPQVDGEPDPDFVYFPAMTDDSWTYVPAVEYSWEIVEDTEAKAAAEAQIALKQTVQAAINFGQQLLVDFAAENIQLGITQDGMTKTVRQNMAEVMSAISTGSLYDAIEEIDAIPAEAKDDKYITDERLAVYKQRIVDYLGV
jgi:hypothetical protein